jgi:hypothetical protein
VRTRHDFAEFLSAVLADFESAGAAEWDNGTLDRFFVAFAEGEKGGGPTAPPLLYKSSMAQRQSSWSNPPP